MKTRGLEEPPVRTQPARRTRPPGRVQKDPNAAIGYGRVSTEEQARLGVSLDAQAEKIRAYFTMAGLTPIGVVLDEGVSGSKKFEKRPGGAEVLDAIRTRQASHIVALKLDRLFRDAENALAQTRQWDEAGVTLHIIDMGGNSLNTRSPMGRMFLTMVAAFAEFERNMIRERTAMALRMKKEHLKVYSPTPLGFRREGEVLIADAAEAATVDRIRAMRAEGASYRAIAAMLNADGTPTKKGRSWFASTIQKVLENSIHQ